MTFLVIAKDGSDQDAPQRRQTVREQHLAGVKDAVESGLLKVGGAILDDNDAMIGSALVVEVESREALETYLQNDIYTKSGVWQNFEIYPFKRAV